MSRSNINNLIGNPFYIQGFIWGIVVVLYKLRWSYLYPSLSPSTEIFFIFSISFSMIIGYGCQKKKYFTFRPIRIMQFSLRHIKICFILNYFLLFVEFGFGGIPLLGYIFSGNGEYKEFGLPYIHVIVVNGFTALCFYVFYIYISCTTGELKKKLKKYIILSLIPFALIFNRGGLLTCFAGMGIMFLMSRKNMVKSLCIVVALAVGILWGFGYLGDMRTDTKKGEHLILAIGEATPEFVDSWIPKEFFWGYMYLTSPLSNFQFTIDTTEEQSISADNALKLGLFSMTPEIISKRLSGLFEIKPEKSELIISGLNVSSYLVAGYKYLGWPGVILMYLFTYYFVFVTLAIINRKSPYFVPTLVSIDVIIILNVFSNMFTFMGIIPVPFVFMMAELYRQFKDKQYTLKYAAEK
ncbi:hypothetical protein HDR69_02160 [bacterium]|nr:hypothetical protein [bacterium]